MEELFSRLIQSVGEDVNREGLKDTPARAAKAFKFLTQGYHESLEEIVNHAIFSSENDEMVVIKNVEFYSLCEHHLLPFFGKCHLGYLPSGKIIGLSKIPRIVDVFSRRLQIQENLTYEIAHAVQFHTGALGVGVVMEAQHLCLMMRGVEKINPIMKTSCMLGAFREESSTRAEFLSLIT